jgi:osmotically-inducible protein OsmY
MTLIRAGASSPVKFLLLAGIITLLSGLGAGTTNAQNTAPTADSLTSIVVKAQRLSNYTDEQVTEQVETALRSDRYVDDAHVTVTTENGVVTLHGFVQDAWDLLALRRISRKVSGVKKIVNDVELVLNDQ